jgi:hypothetical protein
MVGRIPDQVDYRKNFKARQAGGQVQVNPPGDNKAPMKGLGKVLPQAIDKTVAAVEPAEVLTEPDDNQKAAEVEVVKIAERPKAVTQSRTATTVRPEELKTDKGVAGIFSRKPKK